MATKKSETVEKKAKKAPVKKAGEKAAPAKKAPAKKAVAKKVAEKVVPAKKAPAKKAVAKKVAEKVVPVKKAPAKKAVAKKVAAKPVAKKNNRKKLLHFEGKDLEHYNALMRCLELVNSQFNSHVADALDCSNADKRGVTTHMADVSSDNSRHEMELRMLAEEGDVLKLINDALKRLIDGEYGKCQECGEPIPEGRLQIRPYAVYCVKCKSRHEAENKF